MKMMKRLLTCALAILLVLSCTILASAQDGNVVYNGTAGEFIFLPGSDYSSTDLFPNFKDVMPGDSISQTIYIRNHESKNVKIKVYMRSLGAQEGSEAFLSQLGLRVEKVTDTIMFDASADQTAQLTDWGYLGTLYSGGEVELNVTLDVPTSLDNNFKNLVGYLDWEFMVEELPVEESDPDVPKTGDETPVGLYVGICVGSVLVILLLLFLLRRKKEETND